MIKDSKNPTLEQAISSIETFRDHVSVGPSPELLFPAMLEKYPDIPTGDRRFLASATRHDDGRFELTIFTADLDQSDEDFLAFVQGSIGDDFRKDVGADSYYEPPGLPGPVSPIAELIDAVRPNGSKGWISAEPLPLFPPLGEAQPYPIEALGPTLSRAAASIANKIQVPPAMAAQSVLAVASLAACVHADVALPYGQVRPLELFFATIAASGDRKSSSDNEALWPVSKREKALRDEYNLAVADWRHSQAAWAAEKRKIESEKNIGLEERKARLTDLGLEPARPLSAFLTAGDMTIEGLVKDWPNGQPAVGWFTAEGGMFTGGHGMNADNSLKTAAMLSELWDGKPIKRVRGGDGIVLLPGRRLPMHIMIQPDAAAVFFGSPQLRDQGLLSRILMAAPASLAGTRKYREASEADEASIRAYGARMLHLLERPPTVVPGTRNELSPRALPVGQAGTVAWVEFYNDVEDQSAAGAAFCAISDFAAKAAEHAARIAGVITIVEDLFAREISVNIMSGAIAVTRWHITEALRLRAAGRTDPKLLTAQALLDWILAQPGGQLSFREILRLGPNATRTAKEANDALDLLKAHGRIVEISRRPRTVMAIPLKQE